MYGIWSRLESGPSASLVQRQQVVLGCQHWLCSSSAWFRNPPRIVESSSSLSDRDNHNGMGYCNIYTTTSTACCPPSICSLCIWCTMGISITSPPFQASVDSHLHQGIRHAKHLCTQSKSECWCLPSCSCISCMTYVPIVANISAEPDCCCDMSIHSWRLTCSQHWKL